MPFDLLKNADLKAKPLRISAIAPSGTRSHDGWIARSESFDSATISRTGTVRLMIF
jgi:hypothetical protein